MKSEQRFFFFVKESSVDFRSESKRGLIKSWRKEERSYPERCLTWEATHTWRGLYQILKVWSIFLFSLIVSMVADHGKQLSVIEGKGVVLVDVLSQ